MQVARACRTGYNFADAYVAAAAQEQQGSQPTLSRMPTENEVSALMSNLVMALKKLEDLRDMCQQNRIHNERARENGGRKPEDDDVSMYSDGIKPPYAMTEVKKRRGVSFRFHGSSCRRETNKANSARLPRDGATAATGSTHRNGGAARTAHEPCAMLVASITPSSSASASSTRDRSGRNPPTSGNKYPGLRGNLGGRNQPSYTNRSNNDNIIHQPRPSSSRETDTIYPSTYQLHFFFGSSIISAICT